MLRRFSMYCPKGLSAKIKPIKAPTPTPPRNPNENRNKPLYIFSKPMRTTEPITIYCVGINDDRENRFVAGALSVVWAIPFRIKSEKEFIFLN